MLIGFQIPTEPNQTYQAWEFNQPLTNPLIPAIDENPYGTAEILEGPYTYPDVVDGPNGDPVDTLHIDQDGPLTIWIPNNPDPNLVKLIFWQITADKGVTPSGTGPTTTTPSGTTGTNLPSGHPQIKHGPTSWYTYNGLIEIRPNPDGEWITFDLLESTNIEEIVISTVCMPEPTTAAMLAFAGVGLLSRRR